MTDPTDPDPGGVPAPRPGPGDPSRAQPSFRPPQQPSSPYGPPQGAVPPSAPVPPGAVPARAVPPGAYGPPGQPAHPSMPGVHPPQAPPGGGSYGLGILLGLIAWLGPLAVLLFGLNQGDYRVTEVIGQLWLVVGLAAFVGALILVAKPRFRRTGAGMLIVLGTIPVLFAGVCVALLIASTR